MRSDLFEERLGSRVADDGIRERHLLQQVDVIFDDLEFAGLAVLDVVLGSELLEDLRDGRVLVARHRGEDVVLELPLHAAPQHVRDRVVADGVARRTELRLDEVVLAQVLAEEELLRLVSHRDDGRSNEAREPDAQEEHVRGNHGEEGGPMHSEAEGLAVLLGLEHILDRVEAPVQEEDRVRQRPIPVLELAHPRVVVLRVGLPEEEERIEGDVLVVADLIGERVVHVVLVRPPRRAHAAHQLAKRPHERRPPAAAVHEVVREPARERVADSERHDGEEGLQAVGGAAGHHDAGDGRRGPRQDLLRLAPHVGLVPSVRDELTAQLAEGVRRLGGWREVGDLALWLGQTLDHSKRRVAVEAIHHLRRVCIVVRVDPVRAGRVRRTPARQVIPLIVNAHVEPAATERKGERHWNQIEDKKSTLEARPRRTAFELHNSGKCAANLPRFVRAAGFAAGGASATPCSGRARDTAARLWPPRRGAPESSALAEVVSKRALSIAKCRALKREYTTTLGPRWSP